MKEISAGGVVYQFTDDALKIQLIQDRYGKISLPKGKMEAGESTEQTALREILEETGIIGQIDELVEVVKYTYNHSVKGKVDKEVYYYLVRAVGGKLRAQVEEIRGVEWVTPEEAVRLQQTSGYPNNERVLQKALKRLQERNGGA